MRPELRDQARNRWRSILPLFGVSAKFLDGKQHPCPVCAGKDRFRFDDKDGDGTSYCNVCGARDGVKLALDCTGMAFPDLAKAIRDRLGETREQSVVRLDDDRARRLRRELWRSGSPIGGDMAEAYLLSRGLTPPWPACLRFVERCRVPNHPTLTHLPAMIALVTSPDGTRCNVHRTFLERGRKADMQNPRAMMPGDFINGSCVRIAPAQSRMGVAEGIETAMRASDRFSMPVWSCISSTGLKAFTIPDGVTELCIFGDNDRKYGGQAAAFALAHKLSVMPDPIAVRVMIPSVTGEDWADAA